MNPKVKPLFGFLINSTQLIVVKEEKLSHFESRYKILAKSFQGVVKVALRKKKVNIFLDIGPHF